MATRKLTEDSGLLVAACTTVTATNLCLPSEAMALWERHHQLGRLA